MQTELYPEQITRPSSSDKDVVKAAAASYAERMHRQWNDWSTEEWAEALADNYTGFKDGYEMAKDLDAQVADFWRRPLDAGSYTFVAADALVLRSVRAAGW